MDTENKPRVTIFCGDDVTLFDSDKHDSNVTKSWHIKGHVHLSFMVELRAVYCNYRKERWPSCNLTPVK